MKRKVFEYTAVFEEEKEGGYSVWVPTLPGCASQGETFEEGLKNIKEAIELYLKDSEEKAEDDDFRKSLPRRLASIRRSGQAGDPGADVSCQTTACNM